MKTRLAALLIALPLSWGCSGITVPDEPASHEGVIVERDRSTSFEKSEPTIWVKETPDEECGVIYVVGPGTQIFTREGGRGARGVDVDQLEVGARVRVWTDVVLLSCPGQASAESVELLSPTASPTPAPPAPPGDPTPPARPGAAPTAP